MSQDPEEIASIRCRMGFHRDCSGQRVGHAIAPFETCECLCHLIELWAEMNGTKVKWQAR